MWTADRSFEWSHQSSYINITIVRGGAHHGPYHSVPLYQVVRQGSSQQPGEQMLLNNCCSAAVVSVLAPFCLPGSALSLPLLFLVVLVLHVARLGLGGGGVGEEEQHEEGGDEHEEGVDGQKARHLTLPQLDLSWKEGNLSVASLLFLGCASSFFKIICQFVLHWAPSIIKRNM